MTEDPVPDDAEIRARIAPILTAGEEILAIATQNAIHAPVKQDSAVVTTRRFLIYRPKLLGRMDLEDVLWQDVADVRLKTEILGASIVVEAKKRSPTGTVEERTLGVTGLQKRPALVLYARAQELEEQWREKNRVRQMEEERARAGGVYLGSGSQATPAAPGSGTVEERLRTLKSLHEQRLISDAEYESRKSQIISEL